MKAVDLKIDVSDMEVREMAATEHDFIYDGPDGGMRILGLFSEERMEVALDAARKEGWVLPPGVPVLTHEVGGRPYYTAALVPAPVKEARS
jgi:hypothetical protein